MQILIKKYIYFYVSTKPKNKNIYIFYAEIIKWKKTLFVLRLQDSLTKRKI